MKLARSCGVILAMLLFASCSGDGLDQSGGANDEIAQIAPDCTRKGEFSVQLGEGEDSFMAIPADAEPTLHFGAQGGTHLVLAASVTTPDPLDRYEVALMAELADESCVDAECGEWSTMGQIADVVEGTARIEVGDDQVEIPGLFLVVDGWDPGRVRRISISMTDACERQAEDVRVFVPVP